MDIGAAKIAHADRSAVVKHEVFDQARLLGLQANFGLTDSALAETTLD